MRATHFFGVLAAMAAVILCSGSASAQQRFIEDVRIGLLDHDTDLIGHKKEGGADVVLEFVSRPLGGLAALGRPQLLLGGAWNTAGKTNQIYLGLMRRWTLFDGVFKTGDTLFLEGVLGGGWNDGKIDVTGTAQEPVWKSHGSHVLFRTGFNVGYRIGPRSAILFNFNHVSNAGLAKRNEGMNGIGLTLAMTLDGR